MAMSNLCYILCIIVCYCFSVQLQNRGKFKGFVQGVCSKHYYCMYISETNNKDTKVFWPDKNGLVIHIMSLDLLKKNL